jgi:hypothetical protein
VSQIRLLAKKRGLAVMVEKNEDGIAVQVTGKVDE